MAKTLRSADATFTIASFKTSAQELSARQAPASIATVAESRPGPPRPDAISSQARSPRHELLPTDTDPPTSIPRFSHALSPFVQESEPTEINPFVNLPKALQASVPVLHEFSPMLTPELPVSPSAPRASQAAKSPQELSEIVTEPVDFREKDVQEFGAEQALLPMLISPNTLSEPKRLQALESEQELEAIEIIPAQFWPKDVQAWDAEHESAEMLIPVFTTSPPRSKQDWKPVHEFAETVTVPLEPDLDNLRQASPLEHAPLSMVILVVADSPSSLHAAVWRHAAVPI